MLRVMTDTTLNTGKGIFAAWGFAFVSTVWHRRQSLICVLVLLSFVVLSGYFEKTKFIDDAKTTNGEITFNDSNTGKLLFTAPKGRSMEQFLVESRQHGESLILATPLHSQNCRKAHVLTVALIFISWSIDKTARMAEVRCCFVMRGLPLDWIIWNARFSCWHTSPTDSFRDAEVNWDYVRVLPDGECVSVDGTHLGHNLPDKSGNRYCINLVSVAGQSTKKWEIRQSPEYSME